MLLKYAGLGMESDENELRVATLGQLDKDMPRREAPMFEN